MLNVAGLSDSTEGRCVEMCDPICEVCGGCRVLTIYVTGAESLDGRSTWDWTALRGSERGVVFGLTDGRAVVPCRIVTYLAVPNRQGRIKLFGAPRQ